MSRKAKLLGTLIVIGFIAVAMHPAAAGVIFGGDYRDYSPGGDVYVGYTSDGSMNITSPGAISNTHGWVGRYLGGDGTVTVDGADSTWTNNTRLHLGVHGVGTLTVTGGSTVVSNGMSHMGEELGGSGTVTVDGANSTWTNVSTLDVGRKGTGTLTVTDGGVVSNTAGTVGTFSDSNGTVTVDGANSKWTNTTNLIVAYSGSGSLAVTGGGTVETDNLGKVGYWSDSNGTATVDGANSKWTTSTDLYVGDRGAGELAVTGGGLVSNTIGYVGKVAGSNGTVTVDGTDSKWVSSSSVYVGGGSSSPGGSGVVNIQNGGLVQVDGTLKVWDTGQVNVNNGQLIVGGLDADGDLTVGPNGTLTLSNNATATVQSGKVLAVRGILDMGSGAVVALDNAKLSHYMQQLDIRGAGITGDGEIFVGSAGMNLGIAGNEGSLAGTSNIDRLTVWGNVSGSGSLSNVTIYGNVSVGNSPGVIDAAGLTLASSGTLTMELGGLIAGSEYDQIVVTGALALDGALNVEWYGGFEAVEGDSFTLFDLSDPSADMTGTFDPTLLPVFTDTDLAWNADNLYTTGAITVTPEPATMTLLALGGLAVLRRRRRS